MFLGTIIMVFIIGSQIKPYIIKIYLFHKNVQQLHMWSKKFKNTETTNYRDYFVVSFKQCS